MVLGADAAFGVHEEATANCLVNGVTNFIRVNYTNTPVTEVTATPSGVAAVPFVVIGNTENV